MILSSWLNNFDVQSCLHKKLLCTGSNHQVWRLVDIKNITLKITKKLNRDIHLRNGESIGYYDPNFKENVFYYFKYNSTLYCLKDESLTQVRREKDILNLFPDRKKEIKAFMRKSSVSRRRNFEEYCIKVLGYAESTLK